MVCSSQLYRFLAGHRYISPFWVFNRIEGPSGWSSNLGGDNTEMILWGGPTTAETEAPVTKPQHLNLTDLSKLWAEQKASSDRLRLIMDRNLGPADLSIAARMDRRKTDKPPPAPD